MEAARSASDAGDDRFDGLHAEASAAVGSSANTLRSVRGRYREAYTEALLRWQDLDDELDAAEDDKTVDHVRRRALRLQVDELGAALEGHRLAMAKLELAERTLSRTWLFLERGDTTLVAPGDGEEDSTDLNMRIVEAQEAERARLAQEIHDGPAQALTNAIFVADLAERLSRTDREAATAEIGTLRAMLRRELDSLRGFISQLRPPLLDELGLNGAIDEAAADLRAMTSMDVTTDLGAPNDALEEHQQTVALRVAQEAMQNVRKHANAKTVTVTTGVADETWTLEIRDDGRGFDVGATAARGRRNFGLQFMRERAALIDARFDVRSRPDGGTVVRLAIPTGARTGAKENG